MSACSGVKSGATGQEEASGSFAAEMPCPNALPQAHVLLDDQMGVLKRSDEGGDCSANSRRDPSLHDCQRTLTDETKAYPCVAPVKSSRSRSVGHSGHSYHDDSCPR